MAKVVKKNTKEVNRSFIYLPAIIALSAGLVVSVVLLINRVPTVKALILILAFLLGFYLLGAILTAVLNALATKEETPPELEAELEDIQTSESNQESSEY